MYDETYLAHYGVKGMKWGVRKDDYPLTPAGAAIRLRNKYNIPLTPMGGAVKAFNKSGISTTPAGAILRVGRKQKFNNRGQWTESGAARYTKSGKKKDPTKMSLKDLEKSTKRLHAENQYRKEVREANTNRLAKAAVKAGAAYIGTIAATRLIYATTGFRFSPSYEKKMGIVSALIAGFSEYNVNMKHLTGVLPK